MNIENPSELINYLVDKHLIASADDVRIAVLRGGVSNRTVLVERPSGGGWVLKQALEKLRVSDDWFSDPKRVVREALGMQWLNRLCPEGSVPKLVFLDEEHDLLAMEAVSQPHRNFKAALMKGEFRLDYFEKFGNLLGIIHREAPNAEELPAIFSDTSFFETLRLAPYYLTTAERLEDARGFLNRLSEDCRASSYTLVHGDYSPKNILIHREKLILLDHEVIHFGDGTFDIGFSLCHLLSKAHHLKPYRSELIRGAQVYWSAYRSQLVDWDPQKENRAVRHAIACLLARVHGRSPLNYLTALERERQTHIGLTLISHLPSSIEKLIENFNKLLASWKN